MLILTVILSVMFAARIPTASARPFLKLDGAAWAAASRIRLIVMPPEVAEMTERGDAVPLVPPGTCRNIAPLNLVTDDGIKGVVGGSLSHRLILHLKANASHACNSIKGGRFADIETATIAPLTG
jgi:hypothetical protein